METADYAPTSEDVSFTFGERLGMVFIVQVAFLSAISVSALLLYFLFSLFQSKRNQDSQASHTTHIHHYFLNLLVADLVQAIGSILNIKWVRDGQVESGALCTAQGMMKQIGDVGVALSTLVIAVHTFRVLVFRISFPAFVPKLVIFLIWAFVGMVVGVGFGLHVNKGPNFYGNTGFWCWITNDYSTQRITLEYLWLWIAALVNIFCYSIIALVIKGNLVIEGRNISLQRSAHPFSITSMQMPTSNRTNAIAKQMLFYPAVYLICILPMTVTRFIQFNGRRISFSTTCFSSMLFSASGLLNVILFKLTRPSLIPARSQLTHNHNGSGGRDNSFSGTKSLPPMEINVKLDQFKVCSPVSSPVRTRGSHVYPPVSPIARCPATHLPPVEGGTPYSIGSSPI